MTDNVCYFDISYDTNNINFLKTVVGYYWLRFSLHYNIGESLTVDIILGFSGDINTDQEWGMNMKIEKVNDHQIRCTLT